MLLARLRSLSAVMLLASAAPLHAQSTPSTDAVEAIELARPAYPAIAQSALVGGDVSVAVFVGPDGRLEQVTAASVSGSQHATQAVLALLERAAVDAVRRSRFACTGCTRRGRYDLTVSFRVVAPSAASSPSQGALVIVDKAQRRVTVVSEQRTGARTPRVSLIRMAPVQYPPIAQSARVEGRVELEIDILDDGSVAMPRVVKSIPLLDQAAIDAARQSRFRCDDCGATPIAHLLTVDFRLDPPGAPDVVVATTRSTLVVAFAKAIVINPRASGLEPAPARLVPLWLARPDYPHIARAARVQGVVIVEIDVSPDGRVEAATVTRSIPLLDHAALEAVKKASFLCEGCGTAARRQTVQYEFSLSDDEPVFEVRPGLIRVGVSAPVPLVMPTAASR